MGNSKKILAIGSSNMDVVLKVRKWPVPGESLPVDGFSRNLGGKGSNRAVALKRQGADVLFCCKLGQDDAGKFIMEQYHSEGLDPRLVRFDGDAETGSAYIVLDPHGNNYILSNLGANGRFRDEDCSAFINQLENAKCLSLDLEFNLDAVEHILSSARTCAKDVKIIVDAGPTRDVTLDLFRGVFVLSPNENEAEQLTGVPIQDLDSAKRACGKLYESGCEYVVLKWGARGALLYGRDGFTLFPAYQAGPVVDTTAAGDCFMAALTYAVSQDERLPSAICYANVCAALSVTRFGAISSLPKRREIEDAVLKARKEGYFDVK